jgi:uncharacterized protein
MRKGHLLALLLLVGCFPQPPKDKALTRFVFDRGDLFTEAQRSSLDSLLRDYERRTTNEIVLYTSTDTTSSDSSFRHAIARLNDSLGVGKLGKNNGLVIAFDRHLNELYTLSQENTAPDTAVAFAIQDSVMIPELSEKKYFDSFRAGALAFMDLADSTAARNARKRKKK